jgi:hypothetical protein
LPTYDEPIQLFSSKNQGWSHFSKILDDKSIIERYKNQKELKKMEEVRKPRYPFYAIETSKLEELG